MANPASALLGKGKKRKKPKANPANAIIAGKQIGGLGNVAPDVFGRVRGAGAPAIAPGKAQPIKIASPPAAVSAIAQTGLPPTMAPKIGGPRPEPGTSGLSMQVKDVVPKIAEGVAKFTEQYPGIGGERTEAVTDFSDGDETYQAYLDRTWAAMGKGAKAPKATEAEELRFRQRKAEDMIDRARQWGRDGSIRMGGPRGNIAEYTPGEIGTEAGSKRIQMAGRPVTQGGMGMQGGTQQVSLGGKLYAIPAHLDAESVVREAEAYRHETVMGGHMKPMEYKDALAMAVGTGREVWGDETLTSTIRKDGREIPIDFYLNESARKRAQAQAEKTGKSAQADIPAGRGGPNLATFMLPSKKRIAAVKKAEKAERKARDAEAIRMAAPDKKVLLEVQSKAVGKWLDDSKNSTLYKGINLWLNDYIEGETYQEVGKYDTKVTKHIPGKGSPIKGRKYVAGVLQRGELDVEALTDVWSALKGKYGAYALPDGLLASAMEALVRSHSEWDQSVVSQFYRKHGKEFAKQLSVPATVANTSDKDDGDAVDDVPSYQLDAVKKELRDVKRIPGYSTSDEIIKIYESGFFY